MLRETATNSSHATVDNGGVFCYLDNNLILSLIPAPRPIAGKPAMIMVARFLFTSVFVPLLKSRFLGFYVNGVTLACRISKSCNSPFAVL